MAAIRTPPPQLSDLSVQNTLKLFKKGNTSSSSTAEDNQVSVQMNSQLVVEIREEISSCFRMTRQILVNKKEQLAFFGETDFAHSAIGIGEPG